MRSISFYFWISILLLSACNHKVEFNYDCIKKSEFEEFGEFNNKEYKTAIYECNGFSGSSMEVGVILNYFFKEILPNNKEYKNISFYDDLTLYRMRRDEDFIMSGSPDDDLIMIIIFDFNDYSKIESIEIFK